MPTTTAPQIALDITFRSGGVVEFHLAGCKAAQARNATVEARVVDAAEFVGRRDATEAEARELNIPRAEQQTRFHACTRKATA